MKKLFILIFLLRKSFQLENQNYEFSSDESCENFNKLFNENLDTFKTFVVLSKPPSFEVDAVKLSTVVSPLSLKFMNDTKILKFLSKAEKVLFIPSDDDLSLNETEKFLQNFWRQHKTTRIFVFAQKMIYFYNPFIFDSDTDIFGKLEGMKVEGKKESLQQYPLRVEIFRGTYSDPVYWNVVLNGFGGPDVEISRIVLKKFDFNRKL